MLGHKVGTKTRVRRLRKLFSNWLKTNKYFKATEYYPAAVHAETLIDEFFSEHTDFSDMELAISEIAASIGWVSNYDSDFKDHSDDDIVDESDENDFRII